MKLSKVIVNFNREEALACIIALESTKSYKWQQDALRKLTKAFYRDRGVLNP